MKIETMPAEYHKKLTFKGFYIESSLTAINGYVKCIKWKWNMDYGFVWQISHIFNQFSADNYNASIFVTEKTITDWKSIHKKNQFFSAFTFGPIDKLKWDKSIGLCATLKMLRISIKMYFFSVILEVDCIKIFSIYDLRQLAIEMEIENKAEAQSKRSVIMSFCLSHKIFFLI